MEVAKWVHDGQCTVGPWAAQVFRSPAGFCSLLLDGPASARLAWPRWLDSPLLFALDSGEWLPPAPGDPRTPSCLAAGANVHIRGRFCGTALMFAAASGHMSLAKLLLAHGASREDRDIWGNQPLNWANKYADAAMEQVVAPDCLPFGLPTKVPPSQAPERVQQLLKAAPDWSSLTYIFQVLRPPCPLRNGGGGLLQSPGPTAAQTSTATDLEGGRRLAVSRLPLSATAPDWDPGIAVPHRVLQNLEKQSMNTE